MKLIRIEFELKNPQEIVIWGFDENLNKKEVGCIFTPTGSNVVNAIQICGFREAYDLYGCARYQYPISYDPRKKICDGLENKNVQFIQTKDIQLMFDIETRPTDSCKIWDITNGCCRCYNEPCTCENKIEKPLEYDRDALIKDFLEGKKVKNLTPNPYNVKREEDLPLLKTTDNLGDKYCYWEGILVSKEFKEQKEKEKEDEGKNKV
jgi:hypothetical protein